jgi:Transmembrane domain of unknown function (DUF3566)
VDSGVPQASNRSGSRAGASGVKPPANKTATPKANGTGSSRPRPVDPRTEDLNGPVVLSRAGKTVGRRPGAPTTRTVKHRETGAVDPPIEFSVATPLAPVHEPEAKSPDTIADVVVDAEQSALAPTIEVHAPTANPDAPTELVPAELVPTELVPAELRTIPVPTPPPAPILYDEAATIDDVTKIGPVLEHRPLLQPVHFRRAPKPRIRRVTRVVRHVDTWSVFKVALVFNVFFYAVAMVAGVLLWQVAYATGTIDNVEKFFEGFGWESFDFNGGQIFHNAWIAGLFVAVGLTGLAVLMATLFNLITDLVGGIRLSVLEEEVRSRAERGTERVVYETVPPGEPEMVVDEADFEISAQEPTDEAIAG